ncbi:MAG: CBS domain-containing protein [Myxococcaceae bacterium]|nr:CBS domain-containing protein [Myxococcaceae bacterium]
MQHRGTHEETALSALVTVLPTDTLLCALRVMERHQLRLLPVVEETGVLLGLVSEERLLEAWGEDPLQYVSEVMAECGAPCEEEMEGMRLLHMEAQWPRQAHGT